MRNASVLISALLGVGLLFALTSAQNPWEPTPRPEQSWMDRHNGFVNTSRTNASQIQVVFIGSSSIDNWDSTGAALWNSKYRPLGSVNYGIGGDKIEHCLWRVTNGELDGLNPKLVVLYCGSNNVNNPNPLDVARGVTTTIDEIRARLPNTNVLYVTFNPRGDVTPVNATFDKIVATNREVIAVHNGQERVLIHDMFYDLIISWGEINLEYFSGDKLHLNTAGYELWDRVWNHTFYQGLN